MHFRNRKRERQRMSGMYNSVANTFGPVPFSEEYWDTDDYVGKTRDPVTGLLPVSDFWVWHITHDPALLNYRVVSKATGETGVLVTNWPAVNTVNRPLSPPGGWESSCEGGYTPNQLVTRLLADTNPFNYSVSVPIMISELLEASSLITFSVQSFLSFLGSSWLNYKFGWLQTIQDIRTLAEITQHIEDKIRELNAIISKGGLRTKKHLTGGGASSSEFGPLVSFPGGSWNGENKITYRSKVWGSVRWVPSRQGLIDIKKLSAFNEAAKIVLDLNDLSPTTIWEAIPFSWLVDYFGEIGPTLQAIERSDLVSPTDICIMRQRKATVTQVISITPESEDAGSRYYESASPGKHVHWEKIRNVQAWSPDPLQLSFGILTKGHQTNLIALLLSVYGKRGRKLLAGK